MTRGGTTTSCPSASVLAAFGAGKLEGAERSAVETHIAQCFTCGRSASDAFAPTLMATSGAGAAAAAAVTYTDDAPDLPPGSRVQRYEIRARLGAGAMGTVYEAYDPDLDRLVALKILKTDLSLGVAAEEHRQRLLREARAMARLSHPNVVTVYEAGTLGDRLFLAMELVRGTTLRAWLASKLRTVREILGVYADAGAGLAAAHDAGLVHRDFKPDNVLIGDDGRVRVTDFGLARAHGGPVDHGPVALDSRPLMESVGSDKLTRSGMVVGTPAYMSPEALDGGETDARSDIFAFSVALYESLYRVRPFEGKSLIELMKNTREGRVTEVPRGIAVPAAVRSALLRGLGASREQRPASMHAMLTDLAPPQAPSARGRAWIVAGIVVLALSLTTIVVARSHRGRIAVSDRRRPVFAVLDFRSRSNGEPDAWLGGSIARSVAAEVGAGERARVMSPDDVARKGVTPDATRDPDAAAIARMRDELGAGYLVLGSYEVVGSPSARKLVVDARVVDVSTGKTLQEARQRGDLSAARDLSLTVADDLSDGLGLRDLSGEERAAVRAAFPADPEAMRFYAGGLDRVLAFDGLGARALLEKAVAADPSAPMLHASLARVLGELGYVELARNEARAALEHSSGLARADRLSNEALTHELSTEWDKAAEIQRALYTFFPDDLEYGLRLANALDHGGKSADARQTLEGLRGLVTTASDRVRVNIAYAKSLRFLDDPAQVVAVAKEAAAAAEAMGSPHLRAQALQTEAVGQLKLNETDKAAAAATEAMQQSLAAGEKGPAAFAQEVLGEIRADQGDLPGAQKQLEDSLATMRALGEMHATSGALGDLLIIQKRQEHYDAARAAAVESSQLGFAQSPQERSINVYNHAELLYLLGDLAGARAKSDEAIALRRTTGDRRGIALSLQLASEIELAQGETTLAARSIEEASAIDLKDARARAIVAMAAGVLALEQGHPETAIAGVTAACETHHTGHRQQDEAWCRGVEARLLLASGKKADAIGVLDAAAPLLGSGADLRAARLFGVEDAYVRGVVGPAEPRAQAIARLDGFIARAHDVGCIGDELDARLARSLLEIADGRTPRESLASIAKDATSRGYLEIAAHARARRR
jgi:tRNA A-37 threonylcarbamoyl transferase component Bud32/tetratricopeptide (TPR) repeat protein